MTKTRDALDSEARGSPEIRSNFTQPPQPPKLDIDEYRADLAEFNYTKEQEDEFIKALWNIVCTAIDTGFGLDAVSMIIPAFTEKALEIESQGLDSNDTPKIEQEINTQTIDEGGES